MAMITLDEARPYLQAACYVTKTSTGPITGRGPAIVALAYGCGLQPAEILCLKGRHWRPGGVDVLDVDMVGLTIGGAAIRTRHRKLPIPPHVRTLVEAYAGTSRMPSGDEPVFRDADGGEATMGSLITQMRNPGRRTGQALTAAAFAAAFANALMWPLDDEVEGNLEPGLYEYLTGEKPREGSAWRTGHPPLGALRTYLAKRVEMWRIDRGFWHHGARSNSATSSNP